MSATVHIIQITPEELQREILKGVKLQIDDLKNHFQPKEPNEYLIKNKLVYSFEIGISPIQSPDTTLQGLKCKVIFNAQHQTQFFFPKKRNETIGLILSIFQNLQFINQIITADFDLLNDYQTIIFFIYSVLLLIYKLNTLKHQVFKPKITTNIKLKTIKIKKNRPNEENRKAKSFL